VNEAIDRMRHSATRALLERDDVIIVASVSCLYGIGSVETYSAMTFSLKKGSSEDQREIIRKLVKANARYKLWSKGGRGGRVFDFCFDAILLPSPYASSFGGFVELPTVLWWTAGGLIPSVYEWVTAKLIPADPTKSNGDDIPEDMSTMSLVGGGLIAGDSLAALTLGIIGLISSGALRKLIFGG